jgi:hypothetical protein
MEKIILSFLLRDDLLDTEDKPHFLISLFSNLAIILRGITKTRPLYMLLHESPGVSINYKL